MGRTELASIRVGKNTQQRLVSVLLGGILGLCAAGAVFAILPKIAGTATGKPKTQKKAVTAASKQRGAKSVSSPRETEFRPEVRYLPAANLLQASQPTHTSPPRPN